MIMTGQGLMLTAAGLGVGLVLFAIVSRFMRSFLFGVAASDPVTLAGASLTLLVIAALASWMPARRAARVDPAEALRAE
jgi:ABC-type antimicrobial peptide transport system permease subunit